MRDPSALLFFQLALCAPLGALVLSLVRGRSPLVCRFSIGLALGWMVTWLGLALTIEELTIDQVYRYNRELQPETGHGSMWYVAGFPIQGVGFGNGASFPEYVPWSKGLFVLLLNLLINSMPFYWAASRMPKNTLRLLGVLVSLAGTLLIWRTFSWVLPYID